jgi:hypothetical protein
MVIRLSLMRLSGSGMLDVLLLQKQHISYMVFLYQMYPLVLQLTVHLPRMHMVAYNERDDLHNFINREQSQKSMLTEYFQMNSVDPFAHSFLYREFPEHYRWDKTEKEWLRRKQKTRIGRMVYACPAKGERYYLRVLLNHVGGATSFDDLKTTGTALNSVHNFFKLVYLHVCGGTSQKLSMLLFWLYLSFCTRFDRFRLFCRYHN